MTRAPLAATAALLLIFAACSMPTGAPPDQAQAVGGREQGPIVEPDSDSPIHPSVRPEDLPVPPSPTAAEIEAFHARVRRLSPTEFPDLPAALTETLVERECLIPQPRSKWPLENAIQGEFFGADQENWAVICSRNRRSQILAFRSASDAQPEIVQEFDDPVCMNEERICGMLYGTSINAVGREYILRHHEAHGGPVPPPIDHQGINVGHWNKASVVRYFQDGEWLTLQGAD